MRYYDTIHTETRGGFEIIVDKTWEDIDVGDCFDDSCYDIQEMRDDINAGNLDWFVVRVRALVDGHELGSAYLGGCLYKDAREIMSDGYGEDLIEQALEEARKNALLLRNKLETLVVDGLPV